MNPRAIQAWALAFLLCLQSICGGFPVIAEEQSAEESAAAKSELIDDTICGVELPDFKFKLSEGKPRPQEPEKVRAANAEPLSEEETQALLKLLPSPTPVAEVAYTMPVKSLAPPSAERRIQVPFPPPEQKPRPAAAAVGQLRVTNKRPEGNVEKATNLTIAFSNPMVAVTSQEALAAKTVPVNLAPAVPGEWKWFGTQTLTFEPQGKQFPMSTEYTISIPGETKSVAGARLASPVSWKFRTATAHMVDHYPIDTGSIKPTTLMMVRFNQKINADAILKVTRVRADGRAIKILPATKADIEKDVELSKRLKNMSGSFVVFKSESALPHPATISVEIGPLIPSAEGPLLNPDIQRFSFRTYGPFRMLPLEQYYRKPYPGNSIRMEFSNPIDTKSFKSSFVTLKPATKELTTQVYDRYLTFNFEMKPRTAYTVEISPSLRDVFGQSLTGNRIEKFTVEPRGRSLVGSHPIVVLSPKFPPVYRAFATNLSSVRVKVFSIDPDQYVRFMQNTSETPKSAKLIETKTITVAGPPDTPNQIDVNLKPFLHNGLGNLFIEVTTPTLPYPDRQELRAWVNGTNLGMDAFTDGRTVTTWVTDINSGAPVKDAEIKLLKDNATGLTDASGVSRLPYPAKISPNSKSGLYDYYNDSGGAVIAKRGNDIAIVGNPYGWPPAQTNKPLLRWYVIHDREPYRPGETAHIKGVIRSIANSPDADLKPVPAALRRVTYEVADYSGNNIGKGSAPVNQFGGFEFGIELPKNLNLGHANITIKSVLDDASIAEGTGSTVHSLQVAEFRRPEFELRIKNEGEPVNVVGSSTLLSASTKYYSGGTLNETDLKWEARTNSATYSPPGWSEYKFGVHTPWYFGEFAGCFIPPMPYSGKEPSSATLAAKTDGNGQHYVHIDFLSVAPPDPVSLHVSATVQDVNRQTWTDSTDLLVHPSTLYVGIKSEKMFAEKGQIYPVSLVVTNIDGKVVTDIPIEVEMWRNVSDMQDGKQVSKKADLKKVNLVSSKDPVRIEFQPSTGGTYKLLARVKDSAGRPNRSISNFWVSGEEAPKNRPLTMEVQKLLLIPQKNDYKPGETAKVLLQAPFFPAEGLATILHNGIARKISFKVSEPTYMLSVPLSDTDIPKVELNVTLVGSEKRPNLTVPLPSEANGSATLNVSTEKRRLTVNAKPSTESAEPGAEVSIDVNVADNTGQQQSNAEVTLAVVDDSLLSLSGYKFGDPIPAFYPDWTSNFSSYRNRENLLVTDVPKSAKGTPTPIFSAGNGGVASFGGLGGGSGEQDERAALPPPAAVPAAPADLMSQLRASPTRNKGYGDEAAPPPPPGSMMMDKLEEKAAGGKPIQIRSNFDALAKWVPSVVTDQNGRAMVKVKLPDNLTRYRIMAFASSGETKFGMGESALDARLPMMVKQSAPRFLNYGDKFELPIVVHNQTNDNMEVKVAARATNAKFTAGQGRRFSVPAHDRVEVRFPVATESSGTSNFQIISVAGKATDAAQFSLPIYTPATTEAFATYGEIDQGAVAQVVVAPSNVLPGFGSVQITTSSTALQTLTDAFLYLQHYPYECSEQISSRVLSVAVMKDMLKAFNPKGMPSESAINATIADDIRKLVSRQDENGSVGLWKLHDRDNYPWVTCHVAHALVRARDAKFNVPQIAVDRILSYLKRIEYHISRDYSPTERIQIRAFALYVRDAMGDRDLPMARKLLNERPIDKMPTEALGFLLSVFSQDKSSSADAAKIVQHLNNKIVESAGTAQLVESNDSNNYRLFGSDKRTQAIVLDALIQDGKDKTLIAKMLKSLLGGRVRGRWDNTQDNVHVLLTMRHYFDKYEKVEPDFVARAWLGDGYLGDTRFVGRSNEYKTIEVPMSYVAQHPGDNNFVIKKEGKGRLYYRLGMNYVPANLRLSPLDRGFSVTRTYEGVDKSDDVKRDNDGTWHFKAGSLVRAKLKMTLPAERYFVALVDPLPGGSESLTAELKGTAEVTDKNENKNDWWYWWRWNWWSHENKRDNQTEIFANDVGAGSYDYSYVMRATTPGTFIVPPTKAEEMYSPETFGRAQTETVVIE